MCQTTQEKNKAFVLDAFDTLFNQRDYVAADGREPGQGEDGRGRYHVVAPDLPGFGNTDSPPRGQFDNTFLTFVRYKPCPRNNGRRRRRGAPN